MAAAGSRSLLTDASLSKRANSSFSVMTSSCAVHWDARLVKPSMSANSMLQERRWRKEVWERDIQTERKRKTNETGNEINQ